MKSGLVASERELGERSIVSGRINGEIYQKIFLVTTADRELKKEAHKKSPFPQPLKVVLNVVVHTRRLGVRNMKAS